MAMNSGGRMKDFAGAAMGCCPAPASFWLRIEPHALLAGDQTMGRGPLAGSSGQPAARRLMPVPELTFWTRTSAHPPGTLAPLLPLNRLAMSVRRSNFSGDVARSTATQPFGTAG